MDINRELARLLHFAIRRGLIEPLDFQYSANRLIALLGLDSFAPVAVDEDLPSAAPILENILDYAAEKRLIENTGTRRDLFDTLLMDCVTSRPAEVVRRFESLYAQSPESATDFFYQFSIASDYVRKDRTDRNISWRAPTEFGVLDITINVSKPEKDPRDIEAAKLAPQSGYPACLLCRENEGFAGNLHHPARQTLRLIPHKIVDAQWFLQYSPYIYYNEHCIALLREHVPMRISRATFENLLGLLDWLPHYFFGSNADLPIVGGSILSHEHYQGGRHIFAMDRAPVEKRYAAPRFPGVSLGRVRWPMSALRLEGRDAKALTELADLILSAWRAYSDESVGLLAATDEPHNTITPIARKNGEEYVLDLVLRNNRRSAEFPLGIFHPHEDVQHIKKENIGLIEVLGLAILPPRLIPELEGLADALAAGRNDVAADPDLAKHAHWYAELKTKLAGLTPEALPTALRREVGLKFLTVLEHAGVFKRDAAGMAAFDRFVSTLGAGVPGK